jgi:predicted TPR repeat methyltransferase
MTKSKQRAFRGADRSPSKTSGEGAARWLADGMACHQRGDLDEAERLYERVLSKDPNNADALHLSGLIARRRGDSARAATLIRKAIAVSPGIAVYAMNLGLVLADLGHTEASIEAFEKALVSEPALAPAAFNLGIALEQRGDLEAAVAAYRRAAESDQLPEASFNLGNVLFTLKRYADAVVAYERAIALRPGYARALNNLANSLLQLGRFDELADAYEALLEVEPDVAEARHMLAALKGDARDRADPTYVARHFDTYAPTFEQMLVNELGYEIPQKVAAMVTSHLPPSGRFARAVDLGCGTGLAGRALRPHCDALVGIDLSPSMLEKARAAGGYDELIEGDIASVLEGRSDRFDLFVATDVMIYLGDLREPFAAAARRAAPNALFAFSTELGDHESFALDKTGRFSHARAYVEREARAAGFEIVECRDEVIRMERGVPARGQVFLMRANL